jgi:hypothetical protein
MMETLIDSYGDGAVLMMAGLAVGVLFGAAAQHSRFCLRAAAVEVTGGVLGPRLSIWLVALRPWPRCRGRWRWAGSTSRSPASWPRPAACRARSSAG